MATHQTPIAVTPATTTIPRIYRITLTTIEPIIALSGVLQILLTPQTYLSVMTRATGTISPSSSFLYTELGGAWLYFAFVEAVVLRLFDDQRLWRVLCLGMLLSDVAYIHSAAQAVGGWGEWLDLTEWTSTDWVVFWTTAPMTLVKSLVVLGVGIKKTAGKETRTD